jgi:hypothetical protein
VRKLILIYGPLLLLALSSCQKVIDVNIGNATPMLVIEGNITNVAGTQTISISKTVAYNDANVYPPVSGATVIVSTNGINYTFKEATSGQYTNTAMRVKTGQSCQLTVTVDGKTYIANSAMPFVVPLDSISINGLSIGNKVVKTASAFYRDPPDQTNQYRFVLFVNGVQVKQIFTLNDVLSNGRVVNSSLYQSDVTINTGDKVEVELQCIDANVYSYWYSLSQQGGNGPNNSATPSNPQSNISGGALGYFSVHTTQKKSIVVL